MQTLFGCASRSMACVNVRCANGFSRSGWMAEIGQPPRRHLLEHCFGRCFLSVGEMSSPAVDGFDDSGFNHESCLSRCGQVNRLYQA